MHDALCDTLRNVLPLLPLALFAMLAAPVTSHDYDYYECKLVQPSPPGELEVSSRLNDKGKTEYRSLDWQHRGGTDLMLMGFWYPGTGGPVPGAGSMSISYLVSRDQLRHPLRFRLGRVLPGGDVEPLAVSDLVQPRRNGMASYDIEWNRFRTLVHGAGTIQLSVENADGKLLDSDRVPADGFDLLDAQLATALTAFDAMAADYQTKCDYSGNQIVVT
jgi:hypothetical protein